MEPLSSSQIADITRGVVRGSQDIYFKQLITDSRLVEPGDLFLAIIGAQKDGHDFLAETWEKGAAGVLVSKEIDLPLGRCAIIVDNTLKALQDLACHNRKVCKPTVIGITGSNGKTTTKDLVAGVLNQGFKVLKTKGNLNNQYGLPLTLLDLNHDHQVAVVEMGMSQIGEIKELADIAGPSIGILTNIGETHLEHLGSLDGVAQGKKELVDALPEDGVLIYNGDDKYLREMSASYRGEKISFGFSAGNNLQGQEIKRVGEFHIAFGVHINGTYHLFKLPMLGMHNAYNALAAIAVGVLFNIPLEKIGKGLLEAEVSKMRMEIKTSPQGYTIINDVYNANPISMWHALQALQEIGYEKKIAVLGDMLELGKESTALHLKVGRWVKEIGVDYLFTVGELGKIIAKGACEAGMALSKINSFMDNKKLLSSLKKMLNPAATILIKGSRGMGMEEIVNGLE